MNRPTVGAILLLIGIVAISQGGAGPAIAVSDASDGSVSTVDGNLERPVQQDRVDSQAGSQSQFRTAATVVVEKGNPANYDTIQNAVDNATDGDTVEVRPGIYEVGTASSAVAWVDKTLTLRAPDGATLQGPTLGFATSGIGLDDGAAGSEISGFTIVHFDNGILDAGAGTWTVRNVTTRESTDGIDHRGAGDDWVLERSTINDGIETPTTGDWVIRNTTVTRVTATGSTGNWTIRDSTIRNGSGVTTGGVGVDDSTGDWEIRDTVITENVLSGIEVGSADANWTLENVTVSDNGGDGVGGPGPRGNWTIANSTITSNSDDGVDFTTHGVGFTTGTITTTNITHNDAVGIGFDGMDGNWTIQNVRVADNDGHGISAGSGEGQWVIRDTRISNSGGHGVRIDGVRQSSRPRIPWMIKNTEIITSRKAGIQVMGSSSAGATEGDWIVRNTTITGSGTDGVDANNTDGNWTIRDSKITDSGSVGISTFGGPPLLFDRESAGDWTIVNTSVLNSSDVGVDAQRAWGNWTIRNTTINTTGSHGVQAKLTHDSSNWDIRDTTIRDSGATGVNAQNTDGSWMIQQSSIIHAEENGIDAARADIQGDATHNWWGNATAPSDTDCVGNVDCGNWLTSPPDGTVSGGGSGTLAVAVSPETVTATEATNITVRVSDNETRVAVANATVEIGDFGLSETTNTSGVAGFTVTPGVTGDYPISVSAEGYQNESVSLTVTADSSEHESGVSRALYDAVAGEDDQLQRNEVIALINAYVDKSQFSGNDVQRTDVIALISYYIETST